MVGKSSSLLAWSCVLLVALACRQAVGAVTRDVVTSLDKNTAATTVTSPVFSTKSGQELLLAFVSADSNTTPNTTVKSVTGGGLTWVLVVRTNTQSGTSEIWRAFTPAILTNATVSASLSQSVMSSITVESFTGVDLSGTNGSGAIGAIGSGHAATGAPAASLVTTQDDSLVVGVGNDFDKAIARTPIAGQTLAHQTLSSSGDTYWVQQVTAETAVKGTKVTLGDSAPTSDQYNLSICEIVPASTVATPQLTFSGTSLVFGSVADGSSKSLSFMLTSSGSASVTISAASITGTGFSIASTTWPKALAAGQTLAIPIAFAPKTAGAVTGKLTITSNSATGSSTAVALTGTGTATATTPQLTLSGASLAFGSVADGSSKSLSLTLTSSGTGAVTVSAASVTGTGFSMASTTWPKTLAAGQTLAIPIAFAPKAAGAVTGKLTITSNSTAGASSAVTLSGTGTATNPVLTLSGNSLAFGNVVDGSSKSLSRTLTSSGTSPVTISGASISGTGFSIASIAWPVTLAPGQTLAIPVVFAPKTAGAVTGKLTVTSNSTAGASSVITLSGTGTGSTTTPQLAMNGSSLVFGSVADGGSKSLSLILKSSGTAPLTISAASIAGTGFSIASMTWPRTLAVGQTLTIPVSFAPKTAGAVTGKLTITSNSTIGPSAVVSLSGTGTATTTTRQLTLSGTSLAFGSVADGSSKSLSLTLTSSGTAAVTISAASITGTGFSIASTALPVTLNAGQTLTIPVAFAPQTAGAATGKLTITSNSTAGASSVVTLTGTGTATTSPQLTLSVTSLSFGSVNDGLSKSLSVTLTSTGISSVTISSASLIGTGFSIVSGTVPATLSPKQTLTLTIEFLPTTGGAATGKLTINSNSTTGGVATVSLSGTGVATAHSVDLSWTAPSSSTDPIAGYHIYRSTGGAAMVLLNSAVDVQTTYLDSSVVGGATYEYEVKSVDEGGTESVASNVYTVTIPAD